MGDIFSAISIILVFATVGLDIFAKESNNFISKQKPDNDKPTELSDFKKEKTIVLLKLIGVLLFYIVLFWILLPKSIEILKTSVFAIWNFDMVQTFYVVINFGILIFIELTTNFIFKTCKK
ncbi:MAG: hypothetical protein PF484_10675 [Bacteroidales bacterium]|jgi:CBS domain containing-hemolysin-like protein|nr:hypothetical protein [Bacteroidales bacterium]